MDADARPDSLEAVRRKLNVTWESDETDNRLCDVIETVSTVLGMRLGYGSSHTFTRADGEAWTLFLNACLYEFSDALDEFWVCFAPDVLACRVVVTLPADEDEGEEPPAEDPPGGPGGPVDPVGPEEPDPPVDPAPDEGEVDGDAEP